MSKKGLGIAGLLMTGSLEVKAALNPNPGTAPVLSQSDLVEWAMGLGLVILVILISAWILRRLNRFSFSQGNRLRILGGISVGTRERVILLQIGEKQLLLGVAPGRVETLHVLQPGDLASVESDNPAGSAGGFAERIKQSMRGS
jgi:flagellar protein FliO/FliZ